MRTLLILAGLLSTVPALAREAEFVICDNRLRCVRAPCPTQDVVEIGSGTRHRRLNADLSPLSQAEKKRVASKQAAYYGTLVFAGTIEQGQRTRITANRIVREATSAQAAACRKPG